MTIEFLKLTPRIGRIKYFVWCILNALIMVSAAFLIISSKELTSYFYLNATIQLAGYLLFLMTWVNSYFLIIRRLNDFDYSGWWMLILAVPIFGVICALAIFFIPGTTGDNRFGNRLTATSRSFNLPTIDVPPVRPWARYIARTVDTLIAVFFISFLLIAFFPALFSYEKTNPALTNLAVFTFAVFIWVFIEAFLLSSIGTTLGKWLIKMEIRTMDGKKLNFLQALRRSFAVWIKGTALWLPILKIFTLLFAYNTLIKTV